MTLKLNLDDRTHKQIVEEAIRLIPKYCSQWTNNFFNPVHPFYLEKSLQTSLYNRCNHLLKSV